MERVFMVIAMLALGCGAGVGAPQPVGSGIRPEIRVAASAVVMSGPRGGPFSSSQVHVQSSNRQVHFNAKVFVNWLVASPHQGETDTTGRDILFSATAAAEALAPGTYTTRVAIDNILSGLGNTSVLVTLTVIP